MTDEVKMDYPDKSSDPVAMRGSFALKAQSCMYTGQRQAAKKLKFNRIWRVNGQGYRTGRTGKYSACFK